MINVPSFLSMNAVLISCLVHVSGLNPFLVLDGECLSPTTDSSNEGSGGPSTRLMSQEGVYQLTKDLRSFSEALTDLKAVFLDEKSKFYFEYQKHFITSLSESSTFNIM